MKYASLLLVALLAAASAACGDDSNSTTNSSSSGDGDGDGDGDGGAGGATPVATFAGVPGVTIREVAIYQSLKRTLVKDGAPGTAEVPIIEGRDAVMRIFYTTDAAYDGGQVIGRVAVDGFDPIDVPSELVAASSEENMLSTVNIPIPGAQITASTSFSVGLLREVDPDQEDDIADNPAARWPESGPAVITPDGPATTFRVTIVPFQYNADGSGRLPDTSPAAVERFRQRLLQIYPVANVEVTVAEPNPWSGYIGPDGTGWQQVIERMYSIRTGTPAGDDMYFYGMFNPEASFNQYCGGGCLLGVTLLNDRPPATGDTGLRFAMGVGYPEYVDDTAAHELGHAHGRNHADCGFGIDPQSIDRDYPYAGGQIGVWGLDTATMTLKNPQTYSDIMGYCDNQWISDYNFRALLERGRNVNLPRWHKEEQVPAVMVSVDAKGNAKWSGATTMPSGLQGTGMPAKVFGATGEGRAAEAQVFHFDHMPGKLVIVPAGADAKRIELAAEPGRPALVARRAD